MVKPHSALIDALGADFVRNHFGLSYQRLHNWRHRGIPFTHRPAIAQLAMVKGASLPDDFLAPPGEAA